MAKIFEEHQKDLYEIYADALETWEHTFYQADAARRKLECAKRKLRKEKSVLWRISQAWYAIKTAIQFGEVFDYSSSRQRISEARANLSIKRAEYASARKEHIKSIKNIKAIQTLLEAEDS